MFKLYAKLKAVKKILKVKNIEIFGGLGQKVLQAKHDLNLAQSSFLAPHGNVECQRRERECLHAYAFISSAEEKFLKQKSRNNWLNLGDGNNSFFHKSIKVRNSSNLVKILKDDDGNKVEDMNKIKDIAIGFYHKLLGDSVHEFSQVKADRISQLIKKRFSPCLAGMATAVSREEIRKVIFSMNKNKAPGPDGFSAGFFQRAWPVIWEGVTDAILEFFLHGRLLKEVNATILTLVPKKKNPSSIGDYRLISCCNLDYKCITKIIANRLLPGLDDVISRNQ